MFLLFFNRGFVFKVEFRYIADSFTGSVRSDDPGFCADETPLFTMMSRKLRADINVRLDSRELIHYAATYVMKLRLEGYNTDLSWELRGGPTLQKASE